MVVLSYRAYFILALIGTSIPFAAFFTILIRGKYPRWWVGYIQEYLSFNQRVFAYLLLLRDEYPALEEGEAVTLEVDYPAKLNNLLPLVKWILVVPHVVVLVFLAIGAAVVQFIAWWAILFTGKYPRGLFDYTVGVQRWNLRARLTLSTC